MSTQSRGHATPDRMQSAIAAVQKQLAAHAIPAGVVEASGENATWLASSRPGNLPRRAYTTPGASGRRRVRGKDCVHLSRSYNSLLR